MATRMKAPLDHNWTTQRFPSRSLSADDFNPLDPPPPLSPTHYISLILAVIFVIVSAIGVIVCLIQ